VAGATLTTLSNILKDFYLGPVQEQLNSEVLLMQLLDVETENLEGNQAVIPLHTSRSGGLGSRGELETLPTAGNQAYAKAVYDLKYHYARIQVSGQAISKTKSNAGAFLQAMKSELDYIKNDIAIDQVRQMYGDGSGQVAQCGSSGPSTTVTLGSAEPIVKGFLYIGMLVDLGTAASPSSLASNDTISAVNTATPSVTISTSVTVTSSNYFTRAKNVLAGPVVKEVDAGLQKILATAANTLGGINAASAGNEYWDNLRDTTGGAISLSVLLQAYNRVSVGGSNVARIKGVTDQGLARRLFETADFKSLVNFVNTQDFKAGFKGLQFSAGGANIELAVDRHAPWGKVFFVNLDDIRVFSPADWDFLAKDGLSVKWVDSLDAFQSILFRYLNMGASRRNRSMVVSGLTDTNGI